MAVGEILQQVFFPMLFEKMAAVHLVRLAQSIGVHAELEEIKLFLPLIRDLVADADNRCHISNIAVKNWLDRVQHLAYDIDDLLDELDYNDAMLRLEDSSTNNKVTKIMRTTFVSCTPRDRKNVRNVRDRLDDILTKLQQLYDERNSLGLVVTDGRAETPDDMNRVTTSCCNVSRIVGREGDKEELLRCLLGNDEPVNQNYSVVLIAGMAGIGKTTLAQMLYNDKKVKDHFDLRAWVCVSPEFDVFNISKIILQSVTGEDKEFCTLDLLQADLKIKLARKRFLIVLDDIWSESYEDCEALQPVFHAAARGSKILVTTQKTRVAPVFSVKTLSNQEALSLFAQNALDEVNFDTHPELEEVAEGIVKNCDGLPLALVTLGSMLRTKTDVEVWKELLNSSMEESCILESLRRSYNDLPPYLKPMFAYCSLFPQDYVFDKDELILLWMAEGLLYQVKGSMSMETFGSECFEELLSRYFFRHSTDNKPRYTMHNLIRILAMEVAGEFCFTLRYDMDARTLEEALMKVRHLSFIRGANFEALKNVGWLRTFLGVSASGIDVGQKFFIPNNVLTVLIPQLRCIRVLNLSNYAITEVPQSIGTLKHVRYLNFSRTDITCLPDQVGDLYHLQSLLLHGCQKLHSLPNSLVKLINLRHLGIKDTPRLTMMPLRIGEMTGLKNLSVVTIGGSNGLEISTLKDRDHLEGRLTIEGLHNVKNPSQAKEANLHHKKNLDELEMEWNDIFDDSRDKTTENEVLEELRPHDQLSSLKIMFYGGDKFPSWIGDSSFHRLAELTLHECRHCTNLPSLGHLSSLRKLFVENMNAVKTISSDLFGPTCAFPSLEVLGFKDMETWESWFFGSDGNNRTTALFPYLREISLVNCMKLKEVSAELIPSLKVLHIQQCSKELLKSMVGVSSSIVTLTLENIEGLQLTQEVLEHLPAVEYLSIKCCDDMRYLWESESLRVCNFLVSLRKLDVSFCKMLVSLEKEEFNGSMICVQEVNIRDCERLKQYYCPNGIGRLSISNCPSLESLTFHAVHEGESTLKHLDIRRCKNLEESELLKKVVSSVEYLEMVGFPKLKSFHEKAFARLTRLIIRGCDNIESIPDNGFDSLTSTLGYLEVIHCKNLKSFPCQCFPKLESLTELLISHCPRMDISSCKSCPPNLISLTIGGLKNPMSQWGSIEFPASLVILYLNGEKSRVLPFAKDGDVNNPSSFLLPSSLTFLEINGFKNLKSVSEGVQDLTCLQRLVIDSCPKLSDLPETLLRRLLSLKVYFCPKLQRWCHSRKGDSRDILSQIPELYV